MYVRDLSDFINAVIEFNEKPEFWKPILGSGSRYFLHLEQNGKHYFGLSKFCVFKDIKAEEYINTYRYKINGGTAQLIISNRLKKEWIPRNEVSRNMQNAFDNWILNFFPNYNINNASFISIKIKSYNINNEKNITPETLRKILENQSVIGEIGEGIAIDFENKRLIELGVKKPHKYIDHVSKKNVASGFDISTITKNEIRFIEVKSSVNKNNEFYLSENEVSTLELLEENSFLYLVKITNIQNKEGFVSKIIQNPIKELKCKNLLKPIAFKIKL